MRSSLMMSSMNILCTNDDGYGSEGIQALTKVGQKLGRVRVVAPANQQSTMSNALTLHTPIPSTKVQEDFIVDGTPADCVIMATNELIADRLDLCLSGINHGANMGEDVFYSGTVAGAMEAALAGIPSLAFSYTGKTFSKLNDWHDVLVKLISDMLDDDIFDQGLLYNVNLPDESPAYTKGVRFTCLGSRRYNNSITRVQDDSAKVYYKIGGGDLKWRGPVESDFRAIKEGYISITPIKLDITNHDVLNGVSEWQIDW